MLDYTWEILSLYITPDESGLKDVVKRVNWRFQITDNSYYADVYEVTELSKPSSDNYIKYEDLDEQTIISWIKANRDYDELINLVSAKLEENKNPKIIEKNPPWEYPISITGEEQYLIVIDDEPNTVLKTWGALQWDSRRINFGLKERGFPELTVPDDMTVFRKGLLPVNQPLILNDRVKIYRVDYAQQPEFDQFTQYKENLSWVLNEGRLLGIHNIYDKSVEEIKKSLKNLIEEKTINFMNEIGNITINDKEYKIRNNLWTLLVTSNKLNSISEFETLNWKLIDDFIVANKNDLTFIVNFLQKNIQDLYDVEYDLNQKINSSNTVDELRIIYNNIKG